MTKDDEKVLCIPRDILARMLNKDELPCRYWTTGFCETAEILVEAFLGHHETRFVRRGDCENDPSLKQIIPYVMLRHRFPGESRGQILRYNRAAKTETEARLAGKASIGIGGHINPEDIGSTRIDLDGFHRAWRREVLEELRLDTTYNPAITGFVNDDETDVGSVHFGVVVTLWLDEPCAYPNEPNIIRPHFVPLDRLDAETHGEFESWSKMILKRI